MHGSNFRVFPACHQVMPYSTGCCTPLSNFEAGLNYKDVSDPAVMVRWQLHVATCYLTCGTTHRHSMEKQHCLVLIIGFVFFL